MLWEGPPHMAIFPSATIAWVSDYITSSKNNKIDSICLSFNISHLSMSFVFLSIIFLSPNGAKVPSQLPPSRL